MICKRCGSELHASGDCPSRVTRPDTLARLAFVKHKAPLDWTPEECRTIDKVAPALLDIAEAAQELEQDLAESGEGNSRLRARLYNALLALDAADSGEAGP